MSIRLAILCSGSGRTLENLIERIDDGSLDAKIACVIGSRPGIGAEQRAARRGLTYHLVNRREFEGVQPFSGVVFDLCRGHHAQLVCLAGWLSLLTIPRDFAGKVLNIHPALLPSFGGLGMYGRRVHEAVIASRATESGCTVHVVTDDYDAGPVLLQRRCEVKPDDTPDTLADRVFQLECEVYPQAIREWFEAEHRLNVNLNKPTTTTG